MPTLTRLDKKRVTFKTIAEERPIIELVVIPIFGMFLYGLLSGPMTVNKLLFFVPSLGFLLCVGTVMLKGWLTTGWLVIDLRSRTYRGRRGLFFWPERLRGPIDDLDYMRVVDARSESNIVGGLWALELVWRNDAHGPFRVTFWRRPQSFRLEPTRWGDLRPPMLMHTLNVLCVNTGLPVELPKRFVDSAGTADLDLDLGLAGGSAQPPLLAKSA